MNTQELKQSIRNGAYAWPGGYPKYWVTTDGGCLCKHCIVSEYPQIYPSVRDHLNDGWTVEGVDINWENPDLLCDHCGEEIEVAYED